MGNVLVVVEANPDGSLRKATLNALGAAGAIVKRTGGQIHAVVVAVDARPLAQAVAPYAVSVVYTASGPSFEHGLAEGVTPAVVAAVRAAKADFVVGAATAFGRDVLPRVAGKLQAAMASEVLSIEGTGSDFTFTKPLWAGAVIGTVKLSSPIVVLSVRPTEFQAPAAGSAGEIRELQLEAPAPMRTRFLDFKQVLSTRPSLTEARVVVSGGRGTKGDFQPIEALADALGAAIGASRAVCDAGWQPNDLQVGQTGKVVAPQLYIAVGISGAIQHVAGMKGSKTIVAINKDPDAPIFTVADYGLVGDLFTLIPELTAAIEASK